MSSNQKISGVIVVDKPAGLTSHDAVNHVRKISGIKKTGHAGTLDPFATGVLLILLGPATRLMEYVNMLPKTYDAELTLGATSDTDDITGKITRAGKTLGVDGETPRVEEARVKKVLPLFTGPRQQTPPAYSAVKVKGQKAYQAARRKSPLKLKPKTINIYKIELSHYQYPILSIKVTCSSGTYIRSLARDVGLYLKTGAYLSKLRRTSIGLPAKTSSQGWHLKNAVKLNQLTANNLTSHLLPPSTLVAHLSSITLSPTNVAQLKNGQSIEWGTAPTAWSSPKQPIALFTKNNQLFAIGHFDSTTKLLSPNKIL